MSNEVMIYDGAKDEVRPVTQQDVDRYVQIAQCYSHLRMILREIADHSHIDDQEKLIKKLYCALAGDIAVRLN